MWMLLTLCYGLIKGAREIFKKKALEKNTVTEVLLIYTFISLIIATPQIPNAMGLTARQYFWVAVKAFVIFVAWIAGFKAIKKLPVSLVGVLDLSRVLFASLLGVFVLGETITLNKGIGLALVSAGLLFLKFNPFKKKCSSDGSPAEASRRDGAGLTEGPLRKGGRSDGDGEAGTGLPEKHSTTFFILLAFLSCILNAVSGLMDKILMKEMNSSQLQFWYIFFMVVFYAIYALITRAKISRSVWKNVWIYLLAVGLIAMDKVLFIANGMAESQVTIMTLIKQSSVIVTIIAGKYVFKEKDILHKVICAAIVVAGIIVGIM
ncbi:MAG: DMT family transporter [Treponema sp.]|nr:DMT family transporter [Treponema sp.]